MNIQINKATINTADYKHVYFIYTNESRTERELVLTFSHLADDFIQSDLQTKQSKSTKHASAVTSLSYSNAVHQARLYIHIIIINKKRIE